MNEAPAIVQTHRTALAIDDDAINRRILVRLLEARRWNVVAVDSARAGLEALGERLFDAVLCDLHMPHQSGTELLAQAKQRGFQSYFAAVTASVREADRLLCIEAGFDGFLRKPFEIEELDEILIAAARKSKISSTIGSAGSASTSEELLDMAMWRKVEELVGSEADSLLRDHEQSARAHVAVIVERPGDDDDVERAAHTLASSSLTIGLRLLGETARTLELTVRGLDEAERRAQGRRLSKLLDASIPALARARAGPVATAPALPTPEAAPRPEPSLLRAVFTGHVDAKMVESALGRARITAPAGANAMIVDCRDMAGYEPEARRAFEAWHLRHRADLVGVAVLTDNAIWATLASAIGTLTGQAIRAFRDEPEAIRWLESRRKDSRATQERSHP